MSMVRFALIGSFLLGSMHTLPLVAQEDNFMGTWKLNLEKSKYSPGPGPKSLTVTVVKAPGGFTLSAKGVNADDTPINNTYTATYDGKDVPVTGQAWDAVSTKLLDANTRHTERKKGGKVMQTLHSVVAKDGKSYTTTTTGVNAAGEKINTTTVFEKQ